LGIWLAACASILAALWSVDESRFDLPPTDPDVWSQWASGRESLDAAAGISRLLATVAISYLLVVSVAHLLALAWGPAGLRRLTARLSPGPVAALAATAVLGGSPFAAAIGTPGAPAAGGNESGESPAPVMRVIEDDYPRTTTTVPRTTTPPGEAPTTGLTPTPPSPAPEDANAKDYSVVSGDNFWVIAQRRVRLDLGREGTEAEIRGYWLALMELNAPRMVEPGNPNLLLPGQVLRLPG
jgi:hypothetical protein